MSDVTLPLKSIMANFTFLSEEKVKELLDWDALYTAVRRAMQATSECKVNQPRRTITSVINSKNLLYSMPGYLEDEKFGSLACKLVTSCPENQKNDLPSIQANILLFNTDTGILEAVISATELTKWRTAAASVVATKALFARCNQNGLILGIFGSGNQGEIHAEAFYHFFNFKEVKIWNHAKLKALDLASKLNKKIGTNIFRAVDTGEECAKGSDVIVTATFATTPILLTNWVNEDVHINAVGAYGNMATELEQSLYRKADLYCDSAENLRNELPGLVEVGIDIKGEIGQVLSQKLAVTSNKLTIFQSLGMPVEDCASARLLFEQYKQQIQKHN